MDVGTQVSFSDAREAQTSEPNRGHGNTIDEQVSSPRRSTEGTGKRIGVHQHVKSGIFQAYISLSRNEDTEELFVGKSKSSRQLHLGQYKTQEAAHRAHHLAAIRFNGQNCPPQNRPEYDMCMEFMRKYGTLNASQFIHHVQKLSKGKFTGVKTLKRKRSTRYQAIITKTIHISGMQPKSREFSRGVYSSAEEAAKQYDLAALCAGGFFKRNKGPTNFPFESYDPKEIEETKSRLVQEVCEDLHKLGVLLTL